MNLFLDYHIIGRPVATTVLFGAHLVGPQRLRLFEN